MRAICYVGASERLFSSGCRPVEVEADESCRAVIASRQAEGLAHPGPIYNDVRSYSPSRDEEEAFGVVGGFPCQAP